MKKRQHTKISKEIILTQDSPFVYSEAYKKLRTNMNFVTMNGKYKKIAVTSAIPNEGKSSVSLNLAATLSQKGAKVLLIDCDMRAPSIHRYLSILRDNDKGLSNVLAGEVDAEECILWDPQMKFSVILGGTVPPNPSELLESTSMQKLLDMAAEKFDYVICDTPPVMIVTDSSIISRYCDGILLVIRQKFSTYDQVNKAKQTLEAVQANIFGTVLTRYDIREDINRGYHKYGYGYYYNYEYK